MALLVNKLAWGVIPTRFVVFALVGSVGVAVHLSVLRLAILAFGDVEFWKAQSLATFVAMTSNFVVNDRITYREYKLQGASFVRGICLFYAVCAIGAIANVAVGSWVFDHTYTWWLAGLCGLVIGSVWNYTLSSLFVWPPRS